MANDDFSLKDSVEELLDEGFTVKLFRNGLGSISAVAVHDWDENLPDIETDDFTVIRALHTG